MGRFIKDAKVTVGLVGLADTDAERLIARFTTTSAIDPGTFAVARFADLPVCREAVDKSGVQAICIAPESFQVDDVTSFISDMRVTHPLVSFCLVGTQTFLHTLPGYHQAWRDKLRHYYKLEADTSADDFEENAGLLRDLFLADSVKCRALGRYETTPGAVVRLQAPRPYGFWLIILVALAAAVLGGAVGPVLDRIMPPPTATAPQ